MVDKPERDVFLLREENYLIEADVVDNLDEKLQGKFLTLSNVIFDNEKFAEVFLCPVDDIVGIFRGKKGDIKVEPEDESSEE